MGVSPKKKVFTYFYAGAHDAAFLEVSLGTWVHVHVCPLTHHW